MDDTHRSNLLFWSEFAIVKSGSRVVECVNIGTLDCECLRFMSEAEVVLLIFVVDVRYFSKLVRLLLSKET